jgi:hypothetical protein
MTSTAAASKKRRRQGVLLIAEVVRMVAIMGEQIELAI